MRQAVPMRGHFSKRSRWGEAHTDSLPAPSSQLENKIGRHTATTQNEGQNLSQGATEWVPPQIHPRSPK